MEQHEIRTRVAVVRLEPSGILRVTMLPGSHETLSDAQENIRHCSTLAQGQRRPALVDIREMRAQDRDARMFYGGPEAQQVGKAVALLVGGRVSTMIGNFFVNVAQPAVLTKLFSSETDAISWLQGFLT